MHVDPGRPDHRPTAKATRFRRIGATALLLVLVAPGFAVAGSSTGAAVSAKHPVTNATTANAQGTQDAPAVASSPSGSLVVWQEVRGSSRAILGARISPSGTLLDPQGILIAESDFLSIFGPAVAWNGTRFLVMFSFIAPRSGPFGVRGALVSPSGVVSSCQCFVESNNDFPSSVALASNGSGFLTAWYDDGIVGARFSATGERLDEFSFEISPTGADPSVAFDGSRYLVAWRDDTGGDSDVRATRVTNAGVVQDVAGVLVSGAADNQSAPTVAGRPGGFLVGWQDRRTGNSDIRAARVSDGGVVADATGIAVSTAAGEQTLPAAAWNGTQFLLAWTDARTAPTQPTDIRAARVTTAGTVLDPSSFVVSGAAGAQSEPAVAGSDSTVMAAWSDRRNIDDIDIFGAQVSGTTVSPTAGRLISRGPAPQLCSDIGFNGTDYFVVWQERHGINTSFDIFGARISPGGVMRDPDGIPISTATGDQTCPAVGWNGSNFLVAWSDDRGSSTDVFGTLVSPTGTVDEPQGLLIAGAAGDEADVDVTANATAFLVAWELQGNIRGTRLTPAGAIVNVPALVLSGAAGAQITPALTANPNGFLAVWADERTGNFDIRATRMGNAGPPTDPTGRLVAGGTAVQRQPAVAWSQSSQRFLVAYTALDDEGFTSLVATRLSGGAVVLDPDGIFLFLDFEAFNPPESPAVEWNGSQFVVFAEHESCSGPCDTSTSALIGIFVTAQGTAGEPFPVADASATRNLRAAAVRGSGNQVGVSDAELPTNPYRGSERVFFRTVAPK